MGSSSSQYPSGSQFLSDSYLTAHDTPNSTQDGSQIACFLECGVSYIQQLCLGLPCACGLTQIISLQVYLRYNIHCKCAWILKAGNRQLDQLLPTLMWLYYTEDVSWIKNIYLEAMFLKYQFPVCSSCQDYTVPGSEGRQSYSLHG